MIGREKIEIHVKVTSNLPHKVVEKNSVIKVVIIYTNNWHTNAWHSTSLQEKCLLATKNFWRTQKALSKNLICNGKIKPLQILGKMWNICDQQEKLSQLCVIAVTNTNILEGIFPPYYLRGTIKNLSQKVYYLWR